MNICMTQSYVYIYILIYTNIFTYLFIYPRYYHFLLYYLLLYIHTNSNRYQPINRYLREIPPLPVPLRVEVDLCTCIGRSVLYIRSVEIGEDEEVRCGLAYGVVVGGGGREVLRVVICVFILSSHCACVGAGPVVERVRLVCVGGVSVLLLCVLT